jgi:hypothetical protein
MNAAGATLPPIDLVLVAEHEAFLERALATLLAVPHSGSATLLTTQLARPVARFDDVAEALRGRAERRYFTLWHRKDWALVGPPRSNEADREARARAFLEYPSPGRDEARIRFFAEHYAWSLHSWYGTYQEGTSLFVALDPELARAFSAGGEGEVDRRANVLVRYPRVARPGDFGRFALFYDHGREAHFAWRLARESGGFPLILFELPERSRLWWQRAPWLQPVAAQRSEHPAPLERRLYRITDGRLFDAITWRGRGQAELPSLIVPDGTDPADAFEFLDRIWRGARPPNLSVLGDLRDAGERVGWAQTYVYGGGSEEVHGVFYARDSAVTARFCEILADCSEPGERLLHGRT